MVRSIPNSRSVQIPPLIPPRSPAPNASLPHNPLSYPSTHSYPPFSEVPSRLNSHPSTPVSCDYSPPPCGAPPLEGSTLSPYSSRLSPTSSLSHSLTSVDSTFFHDLLRAQGDPQEVMRVMGFKFNGPPALKDFINADLVSSSTTKKIKSKWELDNLLAFGVNFYSGLSQPLTPRPSALNHSASATPSQLPSYSRRTHTSSFSQ
ncbi:hypothetical protein AMTRI_Chr04g188580 [Amborella trichopoda]